MEDDLVGKLSWADVMEQFPAPIGMRVTRRLLIVIGERNMRTSAAGLPARRLQRAQTQKQISRVIDRLLPKEVPCVLVDVTGVVTGFMTLKSSVTAVSLPAWKHGGHRDYHWDGTSVDGHGRRIFK